MRSNQFCRLHWHKSTIVMCVGIITHRGRVSQSILIKGSKYLLAIKRMQLLSLVSMKYEHSNKAKTVDIELMNSIQIYTQTHTHAITWSSYMQRYKIRIHNQINSALKQAYNPICPFQLKLELQQNKPICRILQFY